MKAASNKQHDFDRDINDVFFEIQNHDADEDIKYLESQFDQITKSATSINAAIDEYTDYCRKRALNIDQAAVSLAKQILATIFETVKKERRVNLDPTLPASQYGVHFTRVLQQQRALLHSILTASLVIDWRSPSYGQSTDAAFFASDSQESKKINYNRYRSTQLELLEHHLAFTFGADMDRSTLLLTSSGMAAYNLLENYLLRHVLKPDDTVLIPHYIYFETYEQISSLSMFNLVRADTHDTDQILKLILERKPRLVFLDNLTNTVELRVTDVAKLIHKLQGEKFESPIYIIVDGTMTPGQMDLFSRLGDERIKILYYESCGKYLQLGLDIFMGGLVVVPAEIASVMRRLRTNTGVIMYDNASNIFPIYSAATFEQRMKRFGRNAILLCQWLQEDVMLKNFVHITYPGLESHPDHKIIRQFSSLGSIVTFSFHRTEHNNRDTLKRFIKVALSVAKIHGISLVEGLSFGFSSARIFACSEQPENNNSLPYLRLSVGDRSYAETKLLAKVLLEAFKTHITDLEKESY